MARFLTIHKFNIISPLALEYVILLIYIDVYVIIFPTKYSRHPIVKKNPRLEITKINVTNIFKNYKSYYVGTFLKRVALIKIIHIIIDNSVKSVLFLEKTICNNNVNFFILYLCVPSYHLFSICVNRLSQLTLDRVSTYIFKYTNKFSIVFPVFFLCVHF